MKQKILWKVILISLTILLAVIFFLPNTPVFQYMPGWWQNNMPSKGIVLGLDLRGGLHLVYEVEGEKAIGRTIERYVSSIKDILAKRNLTADVIKSGSQFNYMYKHDVKGTSGLHAASRGSAGEPARESAANLGTNRHAECADCHNGHGAKSGNHAIGGVNGNIIGANGLGSWGVKPTWNGGRQRFERLYWR